MSPPEGADPLTFYVLACQRAHRTLVVAVVVLVVLTVVFSATLTVVLVQYHQQSVRYKAASADRHQIENKVDDLRALLRDAQKACQ